MNSLSPQRQIDYGFIGIITLVVAIAIWLLLMPIVPAIASATLNRFHLHSGSFVRWVVQFPIPAMYNFANRYEIRADPDPSGDSSRLINHFPARVFTFADGRFFQLIDHEDRWVTIESSYRGQIVRSEFHLEPIGTSGFRVNRLSVEEVTP